MPTIGIDNLSNAINGMINEYAQEVRKEIDKATRKAAKAAAEELRESGYYADRTGEYRKSLKYSAEKNWNGSSAVVYASGKHARLTHLLENGHVTRDGTTRTREFSHWEPAAENAAKQYSEDVEKRLEKLKK